MGEGRNGSASGSRGPSGRASVSSLATQGEVDACATLECADLRSLVLRVLDTPSLDLRPFTLLKPRQVADLIDLPEWQTLCKAMVGLAVINREDRWTKSQWRGLAFFNRSASAPKAEKARGGNALKSAVFIDVRDASEDDE